MSNGTIGFLLGSTSTALVIAAVWACLRFVRNARTSRQRLTNALASFVCTVVFAVYFNVVAIALDVHPHALIVLIATLLSVFGVERFYDPRRGQVHRSNGGSNDDVALGR